MDHINNFLEIYDTIKISGATKNAIWLRHFFFSLGVKEKALIKYLPKGKLITWNVVARKFLEKYFPPAKSAKMRSDITSFA